MSDIVYQHGTSGAFRHASGGQGAQNQYPWITHPRQWRSQRPEQPRFLLSDEPWADERATFEAHISAGNFGPAMRFIVEAGFRIEPSDVPEATREQFRVWLSRNTDLSKLECLAGPGWPL